MPGNNRTAWTVQELHALRAHAYQGAAAVAILLGRTVASVKAAANRHRISLRQPGHQRGHILGQPPAGRWIDQGSDGSRLAAIRADVLTGAVSMTVLEERVRQGLFREDLFHRLNVIRLRLPPLKERREDIPDLATHFLARSARELGGEPKQLTSAAMAYLTSLPFPGNVRQLENLCHWLTVMAPGQTVDVNDLPPELRQETTLAQVSEATALSGASVPAAMAATPLVAGNRWTDLLATVVDGMLLGGVSPSDDEGIYGHLMQDFERTLIARALHHTGGRRIEAAQLLGIGRNTITRKIQELRLDEDAPAKVATAKDHPI